MIWHSLFLYLHLHPSLLISVLFFPGFLPICLEDFMDEEDMSEHGIAPRMVKTTDQFESRKRPRVAATEGRHDAL